MIYQNMTQLIGKTPLVALQKYGKEHNLKANILAKLELFNPAGSAKDRIALNMVLDAEGKRHFKARRNHHRAHIGQYRHWSCGCCSSPWLSGNFYYAGEHEH